MDYKPTDLFVGVIDLFAIVLPGAVFSYCYSDLSRQFVFGPVLPQLTGDWLDVVVFTFGAYLTGHFIFLIGSRLDKAVGDPLRAHFYKDQTLLRAAKQRKWQSLAPAFQLKEAGAKRLSRAHPSLASSLRQISTDRLEFSVFMSEISKALSESQLKEHAYHILDAAEVVAVNTFQWAKATVELGNPQAAPEIHRLEADSKFFRSLIVVTGLVTPVLLYKASTSGMAGAVPGTFLSLVILAGLSLLRYVEQRDKSIRLAYTYVLVLGTDGQAVKRE